MSSCGIQLGARWQFCSTTQMPLFAPSAISAAALGPCPWPRETATRREAISRSPVKGGGQSVREMQQPGGGASRVAAIHTLPTCKLQQSRRGVGAGREYEDERCDGGRVGIAGMQVERRRLDIPDGRGGGPCVGEAERWGMPGEDNKVKNGEICKGKTCRPPPPLSHFLPRLASTNSCTAGTTLSGRMQRTTNT